MGKAKAKRRKMARCSLMALLVLGAFAAATATQVEEGLIERLGEDHAPPLEQLSDELDALVETGEGESQEEEQPSLGEATSANSLDDAADAAKKVQSINTLLKNAPRAPATAIHVHDIPGYKKT